MSMIRSLLFIGLFALFLTACAGNSSGSEQQTDYETTKKMVVDILKSDDGKKAMTEVLSDEKMQQSMVLESKVVSDAVNKALTSEQGKEFWTKMFSDPKFVKGFADSMKKEHEELLKGLMKDSEYQKLLIDVFQNPEMVKQMQTVMEGQKFREHLEKTIQETLNSPIFKAEMTETLLKAAEKMKQGEGQGQQSKSGGGEGGGGGGTTE
ncbi:spore germination lipoprotein GerD [Thalassobacillus devorans]|uniref:spore germination lipoprotein GerD n=1 Tax=Thalassobacillus devorans TaxID=279813 RepID=UPI0004B8BA5F|nr:spore germination lipoprotein GerD [Thalassobacillus devorans]